MTPGLNYWPPWDLRRPQTLLAQAISSLTGQRVHLACIVGRDFLKEAGGCLTVNHLCCSGSGRLIVRLHGVGNDSVRPLVCSRILGDVIYQPQTLEFGAPNALTGETCTVLFGIAIVNILSLIG